MITTIQKWGNSQGIRIPKAILELVHLSEGQTVELETLDDSIIIHKTCRLPKSLDEMFEGYDGDYKCTEADWGPPVGKEKV